MYRRQNKNPNDGEGKEVIYIFYGEKLKEEINIEVQICTNLHQIKKKKSSLPIRSLD